MRLLIIIFLIFLSLPLYSYDLSYLRNLLSQSATDESKAETLYKELAAVKDSDAAIWRGFKAMSELMMCNYVSNPYSKLSHFKEGRKLLEAAIIKENSNVELRYFRFSVQTNVPAILNYSSNIDNDKLFLLNYLKSNSSNSVRDNGLFVRIKDYMLKCSDCSAKEKETIKLY